MMFLAKRGQFQPHSWPLSLPSSTKGQSTVREFERGQIAGEGGRGAG